MRKVSPIVVLIALIVSACSSPRAPASTPLPDPTIQATETTTLPTATSAIVIQAVSSATPFVFPQLDVRAPICDGAPATHLIVHERGRVTNDDPKPLNVRETAGTDGRIVEQLETLDIFMVIDGPRCANDFTWYKIRIGDVEGWVAEGDAETYYVEPYFP